MTGILNRIAQIISVTLYSFRTLPQRWGAALTAMAGIAGVVGVMVGVLSIAAGFKAAMSTPGPEDTAIVMRGGADNEMMSGLSREDTRNIADAAGIARSGDHALASPELFVVINLPKRSTGTDANVPLRGLEQQAFEVHEEVRIIEGRRFETGKNEVIVGAGAAGEFAGLEVGGKVRAGSIDWDVVGVFTADGGVAESEIWTDAGVLQPAYKRGDSFQSVHVKLVSEAAYNDFKDALTADPRLNIKVMKQGDYYASQAEVLTKVITTLGGLVAGLMGIGAIFGALNTMYSAVSARTQEIATLRALGFGRVPILVSVLAESLLLAVLGGIIGGSIAYFAFDGFKTSTLNWQTFSQVTFAFDVSPALIVAGIAYAAFIGLIGGFFPALRAVCLRIAGSLRGE